MNLRFLSGVASYNFVDLQYWLHYICIIVTYRTVLTSFLKYDEHLMLTLFFYNTFTQVGFKMFLGVTASVTNWDADGTSCSLVLEDNPLVDFVELPDTCQGLYYCNILSGVVRGALEMVSAFSSATQV